MKGNFLSCLRLATIALLLSAVGCGDPASQPNAFNGPTSQVDQRGKFFKSVADNLNRMEDFQSGLIVPQMRDSLNHWLRKDQPDIAWKADPIIATFPEDWKELPAVKRIDATEFDANDIGFMQECVWLRDIARSARGEGFDDLAIASRLFDWVVRNLPLDADTVDGKPVVKLTVGELLLCGRATAEERAWVFILLCRQQGIHAVMLAIPDATDKDKLRPWLPAVLVNGELYLFDTWLGLPIPGPNGKPVATLVEVAADDGLLRALDLDAERKYPFQASDAANVVALVEASPGYLSRGMKLVESRLTANKRVVLTTSPTAEIDRLKAIKHVGDARVWSLPFETIQAISKRDFTTMQDPRLKLAAVVATSPLGAGRVRQFKGKLNGEDGSRQIYSTMRSSDEEIEQVNLSPEQKAAVRGAKEAASFWLGLIAYDEKDDEVAIDFFKQRVIANHPNGIWTGGARYALGRTYERTGDVEKAIAQYQLDSSPQSHGNKLRVRRLIAKKPEN